MKISTRGFTIVELLIVIVVIAILATISIVTYNGVQARAENNKTINVVGVYAKAFHLYAIDNGVYPSSSSYPCLGTYSTNQCAKVVSGTPGCGLSGSTLGNATFDSLVAQYLGSGKPSGSEQRINCLGEQYVGAYVLPNEADPKSLTMNYFIKGDVDCPLPGGLILIYRTQDDETTRCYVRMPTL